MKKSRLSLSKNRPPSAVGSTIVDYFKNSSTSPKVNCPVCSLQLPLSSINAHLDANCGGGNDNGDCGTTKNGSGVASRRNCTEKPVSGKLETLSILEETVETLSSVEPTAGINANKRTSNNPTEPVPAKRIKTAIESRRRSVEYFSEDDGEEFLAAVEEAAEYASPSAPASQGLPDSQGSEKENLLTNSPQSSQTGNHLVQLSPGISYNPARYGGLSSLSPQGEQLIRTKGRTAAQKYSPARRRLPMTSPRKEGAAGSILSNKEDAVGDISPRKEGAVFGIAPLVPIPSLPQHDPYTPRKRLNPDYVPYYVTNFEYIIRCVIDCTDDRELFDDEEIGMIEAYRHLPLSARKLYVRLFNRKHTWIPETNIRYEECPDVEGDARRLVAAALLQDKSSLDELGECLSLLLMPEIRILAKEFHVPAKLTSKSDVIAELTRLAGKKSLFASVSSLKDKIMRRARELCGTCYRLQPTSRSVLNRVLCLWGVSQWWEERENDRPPSSLTTLLLANQGRVIYPQYSILRERKVFRSREDLLRFEHCVRLEDRVESALAAKDWDEGYAAFKDIQDEYDKLMDEKELMSHVRELPTFLRRLTAPAVLMYGLSRCVDLLEKMRKHDEAVELLEKLLRTDFLQRYRGIWWERLSLDLENHLKQPQLALERIEVALQDEAVRGGRRMSLCQRITKICRAKKNGHLETRLAEFSGRVDWSSPSLDDLPTVVVSGRLLSKDGASGSKSVFVVQSEDGGTTYCNVEELVREHYKGRGLPEGSHAEGAIFNSLLGLVFWDIIYLTDIKDVFRDPTQAVPLDWDTDDFYPARQAAIHSRLLEVAEMTSAELCDLIACRWAEHENVASIVSWDRFRDADHLTGLVRCIPPDKLSRVLHRMITDHRTYRSGLPDLTLWNPDSGEVWFVEVKGPGDKLSFKQILWIRFLKSIGLNAEVCHVDPSGSLEGRGFRPLQRQKASPSKKSEIAGNKKSAGKQKSAGKRGKQQKMAESGPTQDANSEDEFSGKKKRSRDKKS